MLSFCATVNATQLIDKPTRVTENSRSLLDVILVSDPVLVKSSGVLEITISDHFLVYVVNRHLKIEVSHGLQTAV